MPKVSKKVVTTFSEIEVLKLLAAPNKRRCRGFRDYCLILTFIDTGALYMMRRAAKVAALDKRVHPHLFRHSFAINFIRQTGNPWALQEIGGWADMEIIKVYMRLAHEQPKESLMKMWFPLP